MRRLGARWQFRSKDGASLLRRISDFVADLGGVGGGGGFENGEGFGGGLELSLPAVNGLDGGHEIDSSCQLPSD